MKFKYKYKNYMYLIFALIYVLAAVCFGWNLYRLIVSLDNPVQMTAYEYIRIALCLVLPIAFALFVTSAIISSYYLISEKHIKVAFGFLSDKYKTSEVSSLVKNIRTNRLTIVFADESTLNVVIEPAKFDDFCSEIMKHNRNVSYEQTDSQPK